MAYPLAALLQPREGDAAGGAVRIEQAQGILVAALEGLASYYRLGDIDAIRLR